MDFRPGRFRHYSGRQYELLGVGRHSETLEELAFYRACYDDAEFGPAALWVRPKAMFFGIVDTPSGPVPRFERIG